MKALVYEGPRNVKIKNVPDAKMEKPTDALVKITTTNICGSDLHMYEGRTNVEKGKILGHENLGEVIEVGKSVYRVKVGDLVCLPFNVSCGYCENCERGYTSACLEVNPGKAGGAYGYAGMGPYSGGQAEFVLVPYADFNCLKLPGKPGDKWEDDFLLLSDVFPTGYHATELAQVSPGKSVAIFGAGPVGLLAAHSAMIRGAADVYVVDRVKERLDKAREIGAIPVNFADGDPVEQIRKLRKNDKAHMGSLRPGEAEKLTGVDCVIDAVGYQAHDEKNPGKEKPTQVIEYATKLVNAAGNIALIGVYMAPDPGGKDEQAKQGIYPLPIGEMFDNAVTIGMGQAPVKRYNEYLRDLILQGKAHPGQIVSHHIRIDKAPEAYDKFDKRTDGYTKVLIQFKEAMAA